MFVARFNCALAERIMRLYCSLFLYHTCATQCRKSEKTNAHVKALNSHEDRKRRGPANVCDNGQVRSVVEHLPTCRAWRWSAIGEVSSGKQRAHVSNKQVTHAQHTFDSWFVMLAHPRVTDDQARVPRLCHWRIRDPEQVQLSS